MSYVVLARRWRPTQFDEVVGQGHVARTLKNAIAQDRVAHAFLFAGARGVGKTSTARILAKAMNCEKGPTPTPCDECVACREITAGQAVDVFEIDGASNRGINEIRDLRESVRYAPSRDAYKIYIIDEVHMLTTEAFNALLKTLEEPPPHAKFIFATTEPQKIPVTILSRCQRYDFKRVNQNDIVEHLESICSSEKIDAERGALQVIARQAAGGMRDALSLLDQIISFSQDEITEAQVTEVLGVANRRQLFDLSEAILNRDTGSALSILDDVNRYGYDLGQFAAELVSHFRDLTVVRVVDDAAQITDLTDSELEIAKEQVDGVHANLLQRYFGAMAEATQELARSSFPKLLFEMTIVRLTQLEPLVGVDLLVERLRGLEQLLEDSPPERSGNPNRPQPDEHTEVSSPPAEGAYQKSRSGPPAPKADENPPPARTPQPPKPERVDPAPPVEPASTPQAPQGKHDAAADAAPPDDTATTSPPPELVAETVPDDESQLDDRWRRVVAHMTADNAPVAMAFEHATVHRFEEGLVELLFEEKFIDLIREPGRTEAVQSVLEEFYGGTWRVLAHVVDDPTKKKKTLADERDEEIQRRLALVESELRNHAVVKQAQSLFDIDPERVRVQVKLFDEE